MWWRPWAISGASTNPHRRESIRIKTRNPSVPVRPGWPREAVFRSRSSVLLKLVDLVIERLETDSELLGRGGLVAVVLLENGLDVAHLDVTQGWRALGNREVGRGDRRVGRRGMLRPASGGELGRQVLGTDRAIAGENRRPFDGVGQLADVPRPVVSREDLERLGAERRLDHSPPRRVASEQVARQLRDVGLAVAQGGQEDLEGVEAEEQVLAKELVLHHLAKIAVRGAENAHVDPKGLVFAHAADLSRLEEPQQLDLHALVKLADLVEEERAAIGDFEKPLAIGIGAGEGPLAMAEELALDQVLGQRAAVDGDERAAGAVALLVEAARDQFLAGPGLAQDHNGGLGGRDRIDQAPDLLHGRCRADQEWGSLGVLEPGLQGR